MILGCESESEGDGDSDCGLYDDKLNWVINTQMKGPELPMTGGASAFMFLMIGLGLIGTAAGANEVRRRRKARL